LSLHHQRDIVQKKEILSDSVTLVSTFYEQIGGWIELKSLKQRVLESTSSDSDDYNEEEEEDLKLEDDEEEENQLAYQLSTLKINSLFDVFISYPFTQYCLTMDIFIQTLLMTFKESLSGFFSQFGCFSINYRDKKCSQYSLSSSLKIKNYEDLIRKLWMIYEENCSKFHERSGKESSDNKKEEEKENMDQEEKSNNKMKNDMGGVQRSLNKMSKIFLKAVKSNKILCELSKDGKSVNYFIPISIRYPSSSNLIQQQQTSKLEERPVFIFQFSLNLSSHLSSLFYHKFLTQPYQVIEKELNEIKESVIHNVLEGCFPIQRIIEILFSTSPHLIYSQNNNNNNLSFLFNDIKVKEEREVIESVHSLINRYEIFMKGYNYLLIELGSLINYSKNINDKQQIIIQTSLHSPQKLKNKKRKMITSSGGDGNFDDEFEEFEKEDEDEEEEIDYQFYNKYLIVCDSLLSHLSPLDHIFYIGIEIDSSSSYNPNFYSSSDHDQVIVFENMNNPPTSFIYSFQSPLISYILKDPSTSSSSSSSSLNEMGNEMSKEEEEEVTMGRITISSPTIISLVDETMFNLLSQGISLFISLSHLLDSYHRIFDNYSISALEFHEIGQSKNNHISELISSITNYKKRVLELEREGNELNQLIKRRSIDVDKIKTKCVNQVKDIKIDCENTILQYQNQIQEYETILQKSKNRSKNLKKKLIKYKKKYDIEIISVRSEIESRKNEKMKSSSSSVSSLKKEDDELIISQKSNQYDDNEERKINEMVEVEEEENGEFFNENKQLSTSSSKSTDIRKRSRKSNKDKIREKQEDDEKEKENEGRFEERMNLLEMEIEKMRRLNLKNEQQQLNQEEEEEEEENSINFKQENQQQKEEEEKEEEVRRRRDLEEMRGQMEVMRNQLTKKEKETKVLKSLIKTIGREKQV